MDFFEYEGKQFRERNAPLADRLRPRTLDEFAGQSHILAPGRLLRRAIQADQISSLIFYGPPGTGKTTLARIIANTTKAEFLSINAVLAGVKDIRESIQAAKEIQEQYQRKTILFVDEVHRFNKAQQDALLPHVENGTLVLIGATTENPYFEVNKALVSRSRIFQLKSLEHEDLYGVIDRALQNESLGYGKLKVQVDQEAKDHLIRVSNGDARALLNALALAVETSVENERGVIHVNLSIAEESIQQKAVLYDKDGDAHFDTISAFIKSLRGSDPDAALYWMAKMVHAGEDPKYIFRRMIIFAGEDIGMADPNALQVVMSASQAYDYVGMPEGRFHLAEACLYLSTAPKSNSGFAFFDALSTVKEEREGGVPNHLKDGNRDKEGFGHGEGYLYPHAYRDHWVAQQYLPSALQGKLFYQPSEEGYEKKIQEQVIRRREAQLASMLEEQENGGEEGISQQEFFEERTLGNSGELLAQVRELFFTMLPSIERENMLLNLNAGNGLFLGETMRKAPEGTVYAVVKKEKERQILTGQFVKQQILSDPILLLDESHSLDHCLPEWIEEKVCFDGILGQNLFLHHPQKEKFAEALYPLLVKKGFLASAENLPQKGQRLSSFLPHEKFSSSLWERILLAEEKIYTDEQNPMVNWTPEGIVKTCENAGFQVLKRKEQEFQTEILMSTKKIQTWLTPYAKHLSKELSSEEINQVRELFLRENAGQVKKWKTTILILMIQKS